MPKKKPPVEQLGFDLTSKQYVVRHQVGQTTFYRATGKSLDGGVGHGWTTARWRAELVTSPPAGFDWGHLAPA